MEEFRITPPRVSTSKPIQVRFFRDRDLQALESAINEWLRERPDWEIVEICQTMTAEPAGRTDLGELVVSVWYIEG